MGVLARVESTLLSPSSIREIWNQYDADKNGMLDREEVEAMLADLTELRSGHSHVPAELLGLTWARLDADDSGEVSFSEFDSYMREYGLRVDIVVR